MSLCEVLGGRGRQLPATFEVHALELRALREVLGGRVTTPDRFRAEKQNVMIRDWPCFLKLTSELLLKTTN